MLSMEWFGYTALGWYFNCVIIQLKLHSDNMMFLDVTSWSGCLSIFTELKEILNYLNKLVKDDFSV